MNNFFTRFLLLTSMLMPLSASAYSFMSGELAYNINDDGKTVTVTFEKVSFTQRYTSLSGHVSIPSTVVNDGTTYTVTAIGEWAFYGCKDITMVTIPMTVTSIGENAFENCSGLTSLTIPASVTSIGNWAFVHCSGLASIVVANDNPKYDSRDNCNAIVDKATHTIFLGCKNTTFPASVTAIGIRAFEGSGIVSVTIPDPITTIGNYAFMDCSSLSSVTLESSVASIGENAFKNCKALGHFYSYPICEDITLGNDVFANVTTYSCNLHVLPSCFDAYSNAEQWREFTIIGDLSDSEEIIPGDLSGDGNVDVSDVSLLIDIVLGKEVTIADGASPDLNNDGSIDVTDVNLLIDIVLGKI